MTNKLERGDVDLADAVLKAVNNMNPKKKESLRQELIADARNKDFSVAPTDVQEMVNRAWNGDYNEK